MGMDFIGGARCGQAFAPLSFPCLLLSFNPNLRTPAPSAGGFQILKILDSGSANRWKWAVTAKPS